MNTELLEKLEAIREDLVAFQAVAQTGDEKKLAELVMQKLPTIAGSYNELAPYMTGDQKLTLEGVGPIFVSADMYLKTGEGSPAAMVEKKVPLLLADLDDIELKLKQPRNPKTCG